MKLRRSVLIVGLMVALAAPAGASSTATWGPAGGLLPHVRPDGTIAHDHGPDRAGPASTAPAFASAAHNPFECTNGLSVYETIHYIPVGTAPNFSAAIIAEDIASANDRMIDEARRVNVGGQVGKASVRFLTDDTCTPVIQTINGTQPSGDFYAVSDDLYANFGKNSSIRKYLVYASGLGEPDACGRGNLSNDSQKTASNANDSGPSFAVVYPGCTNSGHTALHEIGHNLGAVQLDAPNTNGTWHCRDEADVMCQDDGGGGIYGRCLDREWFDCGLDDYFHPAPSPGSYLAGHWNLATDSSWINRNDLAPPVFETFVVSDASTSNDGPFPIRITAAIQDRSITYVYATRSDQQWFTDPNSGTCPAGGYNSGYYLWDYQPSPPASGLLAIDTTTSALQIAWRGCYEISVYAFDDSGNRGSAKAIVAMGADGRPPEITFHRQPYWVSVVPPAESGLAPSALLAGTAFDGSGVERVWIAFYPEAVHARSQPVALDIRPLPPVVVEARLDCNPTRTTCLWSAHPPDTPGPYLVDVFAVDYRGNLNTDDEVFPMVVI